MMTFENNIYNKKQATKQSWTHLFKNLNVSIYCLIIYTPVVNE